MNRKNYKEHWLWNQSYPLLITVLLCMSNIFLPNNLVAGSSISSQDDKPIKIGLLVTVDTAQNQLARQAADAVQLLVDKVNDSGGIRSRKVKVVVKSIEGHWGAGSKRSVNLIYEDGVSAILGFLDGRSAHLVEQVCTKARVPFISVYSPDPTLSRSNIPWFFSTMPHAGQQAAVMANEIYAVQNSKKVIIIASDAYDQRYMLRAFLREVERNNYPSPTVLTNRSGKLDFEEILSQVAGSDTGCIVFFGSSEEWNTWFKLYKDSSIQLPHYLPVMELDNKMISDILHPVFTIRSEQWDTSHEENFSKQFRYRYGYQPGRYTYYVYDGIIALLESIRIKGDKSTEIQQGLGIVDVNGVTGPISFDDTGIIKNKFKVVKFN
ncbi:MAG: ABC transporter substrate-binding protein [Balneolaceae bacterium]|nr:ABC transporter substrate-binding protein [Balneolaceae bacterium]